MMFFSSNEHNTDENRTIGERIMYDTTSVYNESYLDLEYCTNHTEVRR